MQYLKETKIFGKPEVVKIICELFGLVYFGDPNGEIDLTIEKVFLNKYGFSRDPLKDGAMLYVVVPNRVIKYVWPGRDFDKVCYGHASRYSREYKQLLEITPAIAVHKGNMTLYLCLKPSGASIVESDNFGI